MALTLTKVKDLRVGNVSGAFYTYALDASYPSGGYPFTKATLNVVILLGVDPLGAAWDSVALAAYLLVWDITNGALRVIYPQGGSSGGTNNGTGSGSIPSGATAVTSTSAQPTVAINTAPGKEVPAGTNLGNVSGRLLAFFV